MKKTSITLILLIICSVSSGNSSRLRTGVLPFYDSTGSSSKSSRSREAASGIISRLAGLEFINLIERSETEELVKEIILGQSGLIDEKTAAKAGRVHGLQLMITGTISSKRISARAIHIETQKIIAAASIDAEENIEKLADVLASGIEVFLAREKLKSLRNDSSEIDLKFWVEKQTGENIRERGVSRIGEKVVFNFSSNRSGYLTIVDIQPNGDLVVLFPNDMHPSNRIEAGKKYKIPSKNDAFEITVTEPEGKDTLVAFFTMNRVNWLDMDKLSGKGFRSVKDREKLALSRGFEVTATGLRKSQWESKVIDIDVKR